MPKNFVLKKNDDVEHKLTVSAEAKKLFRTIYDDKNIKEEVNEDIPKIKVSELVSKMAFYYEKIRNAIDYNEEYLLRKNAIKRILKRLIIIEGGTRSNSISRDLLTEMIRAGYLPNNKIPETKIHEIALILAKYLKLRKACFKNIDIPDNSPTEHIKRQIKLRSELSTWLIALAASEIDESFGRDKVKETVVNDIYKNLSDVIKLPEELPYEADLKIQIYLSVHRTFMKFDDEMLSFILFKYFNPNWNIITDKEIDYISSYIWKMRKAINYQLKHPLIKQIDKIISRYNVFYTILIEAADEAPVETYNKVKKNSPTFVKDVQKVCNKKYKELKSKLWRASIRSIVYIFLTKSVLAVALEVPATRFFGEKIELFALFINITFPALLLFIVVLLTRMPTKNNTEEITEGIKSIIYDNYKGRDTHTLRRPVQRGKIITFLFGIIYAITYLISFGGIIIILDRLGFNWVSSTIFLFFLAFVSFFSVRIRKGSKEYVILKRREGLGSFLVDFFYVPIVVVGKWLSEKFSRFNVFVFIFDFLLEAPFKMLIDMADEWTKYAKEKKEEML